MVSIIFFIIIILYVIFRMTAGSRGKASGKEKAPGQSHMKKKEAANKTVQKKQPEYRPERTEPVYREARPNVPKKEKKLGSERFTAYKKARQDGHMSAAKAFANMEEKEDILTAAVENTEEVERDNDIDAVIEGHTLETIYDLMAKGPVDTLSFQRDFVAEGMAMLARCTELPDSGNLSEYL